MTDYKGEAMNNQRNKDGTFKSKRTKKTADVSFLNNLLSLPTNQEKQELIKKHNPYFFVLFTGVSNV
jgi:hypothetical protein